MPIYTRMLKCIHPTVLLIRKKEPLSTTKVRTFHMFIQLCQLPSYMYPLGGTVSPTGKEKSKEDLNTKTKE